MTTEGLDRLRTAYVERYGEEIGGRIFNRVRRSLESSTETPARKGFVCNPETRQEILDAITEEQAAAAKLFSLQNA